MYEGEEYFELHILEQGRNYARKGAVRFIKKQGDTIEAVVEGSEYYKVMGAVRTLEGKGPGKTVLIR